MIKYPFAISTLLQSAKLLAANGYRDAAISCLSKAIGVCNAAGQRKRSGKILSAIAVLRSVRT